MSDTIQMENNSYAPDVDHNISDLFSSFSRGKNIYNNYSCTTTMISLLSVFYAQVYRLQ